MQRSHIIVKNKLMDEMCNDNRKHNIKYKPTVLFCFHDGNRSSGATRSLLDLIDNIMDYVDVVAAFPVKKGTAIDYLKSKNVYIVPFCYGRWDYRVHNLSPRNLLVLGKRILKSIITHKFVLQIGTILHEKNVDLIYNNTITINIGAKLKKRYDIPLIWNIREFGYEDHWLGIIGGNRRLYNALNNYADRVICISKSLQKKYGHFIDSKKITIVYNDISPEYIINHVPLVLHRRCNILVAGTIKSTKGQMDVVKAIEGVKDKYPQIRLFIAGTPSGRYYRRLLSYIHTHNLTEYVKFTGFITDMNLIRKDMDIEIVASASEAFGRVTIEAMLSGLLVIGANCGATSELIQNEKNGYLYPSGDIVGLQNRIISVIENTNTSQRIAIQGQNDAIKKYTTGKCCREICKIIKELVL